MRRRRRYAAVLLLALLGASADATAAERIVTLAPHLAELVCAAGACNELVGVSARSDYPAEVLQKPQIGDASALNLEAILALKPTLILAWDGGTPVDRSARLRRLGLRVENIATRHLDDIANALIQIGHWTGHADTAEHAAATFRAELDALRREHQGDHRLQVVFQIETAPAYTINRDSPISEMITLCGGDNVFADLPKLAQPVGAEAMLARQPDVVLYGDDESPAAIARYWQRLPSRPPPQLQAVPADTITRATPRALDGARAICAALRNTRKTH